MVGSVHSSAFDPTPVHPLNYRLRTSVQVASAADHLLLILYYPLKTIRLHPSWAAVLRLLADHHSVPVRELASAMTEVSLIRVKAFLDQLVFKGFLERSGHLAPATLPKVSVIIPVRNRPQEITACLESLLALDYPEDRLEILVVDDASQDATPEAVAAFPVRLLRLKRHRQASFCRNVGARNADGDILAFIDSDCRADRRWLIELIPAFEDPTLAAIGGKVDAFYDQKPLDRYEKAQSSLMVSRYAKRSAPNDPFFYVPACNFLIRRQVFIALNGFDAAMNVGEDVDLCWRLQNQGHSLEVSTDGVVYHKHRNRLVAFCRRRFDYGTSEPLLQQMHPQRVKKLLLPLPAVLFWSLLVFGLLGAWPAFVAALLVWGVDAIRKKRHLAQTGVRTPLVLAAVGRAYLALAYHVCAFVSRYYLFLSLPMVVLLPDGALVMIGMHGVTATVAYVLARPALSWPVFVGWFTLEQLAYQSGVWWGCLRLKRFSSVNPVIVCKGDEP